MKISDIQEKLRAIDRLSLGHFPTALEPMKNLSRNLNGPEIWIKRDDCTGLASGGNKSRKLEFELGKAVKQGADTILTTGGVQSNHARQTAAACAKLGLRCVLLLVAPADWTTETYRTSGNILLDHMFGAEVRIMPEGALPNDELAACAAEITKAGGKPYIVPLGASTPVGALGYVNAALEIIAQAAAENITVTHVISAAGSGATQAGLIAGFAAMDTNIICHGIDIDAERARTEQRTRDLLPDIMSLIAATDITAPMPIVRGGYAGAGYSIISPIAEDAIRQVALCEGIILDSAYTGKAMSALIAGIKEGLYGKDDLIVFLHTGGFPLTFAYA